MANSISKCTVAAAAIAFSLQTIAALAGDHQVDQDWKDQDWKDQDSWSQFTDKEGSSQYQPKVHKQATKPIKPEAELNPVYDSSKQSNSTFTTPSYILMPKSAPEPARPVTHIETTMVPVAGPSGYPLESPLIFHGSGRSYWGSTTPWSGNRPGFYPGNTPWSHPGLGLYPGNYGPYGRQHGYQPPIGWRQETKVVQDGPSQASGNYYSPATPDPTASGNYYAAPANLPTAVPVIQPEAQPKNYWGRGGSPIPEVTEP